MQERRMKMLTRSLSVLAVISAWNSCVPVANAQVESPSPGLTAPAPGVTDQKLDAAAAALERVTVLQQAYRQRLAEAAAQGEKERIVTEANNAFTKAVADQGLSLDEYSSILELAQNDPEVRGKLLQRIHPSQIDRN